MEYQKTKKIINILLADDDLDDRYFFEKAIQLIPQKINLIIVVDGQQLMEYLGKNLSSLPDIIFLDLSMPRKTGIECLSEILENEALAKIPIVLLSTSYTKDTAYEQGIKDMLLGMGASEYIRKPSEIDALKAVIENSISMFSDH